MSRANACVVLALLVSAIVGSPLCAQSTIKHERVSVAATNDEWTPTPITLSPGDILLVLAGGRVRVGNVVGEAGPNGLSTGEGALQLKIGVGAGTRAGARAFVIAEQGGQVKLRIYDTRYNDNAGEFEVSLIQIPASAIPEPHSASDEAGAPGSDSPYYASVRSDLRNLVTAEEAYFADSVRYTTRLSAMHFETTPGVTIKSILLSSDGWSATATHVRWPGWVCSIYVGSGPPPTPGQKEGQPVCWR
jgi:hypothetical protein